MTVVCLACGKPIRAGHRYTLKALTAYLGWSPSARWFGISGATHQSIRCHGLNRNLADQTAAKLKEHPAAIWPEVIDHDIEDHARRCADPHCGQMFVPTNRRQVFCSATCQRRKWMRDTYHQRGEAEQRNRRYQTDPEYRARRVRDQRWRRRQARQEAA